MIENKLALLAIPLLPLLGAILAGFAGPRLGRAFAHSVTIFGVLAAFVLSVFIFQDVQAGKSFEYQDAQGVVHLLQPVAIHPDTVFAGSNRPTRIIFR